MLCQVLRCFPSIASLFATGLLVFGADQNRELPSVLFAKLKQAYWQISWFDAKCGLDPDWKIAVSLV